MQTTHYSSAEKALHWLSALLIAIMAGTGMAYFYEVADDVAMVVHQIVGQVLIVTLAFRILVRLRGSRLFHADHTRWERVAAKATHLGFYGLLVAYVFTGYVSASAFSAPVLLAPVDRVFARSDMGEMLLEWHYTLKWVLLAMLCVHIAAVIKHTVLDRDTTFARMWFAKG